LKWSALSVTREFWTAAAVTNGKEVSQVVCWK